MAIPQLLVHEKNTVGVVVVEGLKAGTDMLCVVTADNSSFKLKAKMDVPIGHKIALVDIKKGDTIWKYGQDIGIAKAKIAQGRARPRPQRQDQAVVSVMAQEIEEATAKSTNPSRRRTAPS